ncbi:MAG: DUF3826 domain-containing protein [Sphingobacteriaceae bacterium]
MRKLVLTALIGLGLMVEGGLAKAQKADTAYLHTIQERSWKIVQKLNLPEQKKALKVRDVIADQYIALNEVYTARDQKVKALKQNTALPKDEVEKQNTQIKDWTTAETQKLHQAYLKQLHKNLNEEQIVAVKDGMTYGVVPLTFNAYQQMLPNLTQEQKDQIYKWLVEAREYAMDAESSEKKHAWFGKYKGKINNYLSAAGIDMKQAGEDWAKRVKENK